MIVYHEGMTKTASDLAVGDHLLDKDGETLYLIDYIRKTDEIVYVEGYEIEHGDEYTTVFDPDDEVQTRRPR
jgi:hypothetical protein